MNFNTLKAVRRMVGSLLFCLSLPASVVADTGDVINDRVGHEFEVEGAVLGMDLQHLLRIYPKAELSRTEPSCFRFGLPIRTPEFTSHIVRHKDGVGQLVMRFDPPIYGGGLSRIRFEQSVDPLNFDIHAMVEQLTTHYGAYDRVLTRRKMEPSGRVVGFEWRRVSGATLRVELRKDYSNPVNSLRLSFLARSPIQARRHAARTLSELCNDFWPRPETPGIPGIP